MPKQPMEFNRERPHVTKLWALHQLEELTANGKGYGISPYRVYHHPENLI